MAKPRLKCSMRVIIASYSCIGASDAATIMCDIAHKCHCMERTSCFSTVLILLRLWRRAEVEYTMDKPAQLTTWARIRSCNSSERKDNWAKKTLFWPKNSNSSSCSSMTIQSSKECSRSSRMIWLLHLGKTMSSSRMTSRLSRKHLRSSPKS